LESLFYSKVFISSPKTQTITLLLKIDEEHAGQAYQDMVDRFLGEEKPLRFIQAEEPGFVSDFF